MRLLFIYFYNKKATFQKDTIIKFSKKYSVEISKNQEMADTFNFTLVEKKSYQEDFYTDNIDIGVVIGKNGTGKSVLINSIRDENNDYSFVVYEDNNKFFYMNNPDKKVTVNKIKVEKIDNFQYIYYSAIIDTFSSDIASAYNISNRHLLSKNDDLRLENRLALIENDDIHKYFNMSNENILDYVKIEQLKLYPSETYFTEITNKIIASDDVFGVIVNELDVKSYIFLIKQLSEQEKQYIISQQFSEHNNIIEILNSSSLITNRYFTQFNKILKKRKFSNISSGFTDEIKEFMLKFQNSQDYIRMSEEPFDKLLKKIKNGNLFDDSKGVLFQEAKSFYRNEYMQEQEDIKYFIQEFENKALEDLFYNYIHYEKKGISEKIINYCKEYPECTNYVKDQIVNSYLKILEDKIIILFDFEVQNIGFNSKIKQRAKEQLLENIRYIAKVSKVNYYSNYYSEYLNTQEIIFPTGTLDKIINELLIKNFIDKDEILKKVETKKLSAFIYDKLYENSYELLANNNILFNEEINKLLFLLTFKLYCENLHSNLDKIYLMSFLNILYSQNIESNRYKEFIIDRNEDVKDLVARINNTIGTLEYAKAINIMTEKFYEKDESLFTKVNTAFYTTYNKVIKNSIKPFTYEINPPLSSGQKAILFIFARISDAIDSIKKESENKKIIILLDEADLKLHMEWQRRFVNDLVKFLNTFIDNKFYILYATHSPMILSDITDDRTVFLKKYDDFSIDESDKNEKQKKRTFGANIYDLYHDSFFMDEFMGEFAQNKINDVINIINLYKISIEIKDNKSKDKKTNTFIELYDIDKIFISFNGRYKTDNLENEYTEFIKTIEKDKNNLKNIVFLIGEPLLRNKLLDDIKSIGEVDTVDVIIEVIKQLSTQQEKKDKLKEYDRETQNEVLKKLFFQSKDND